MNATPLQALAATDLLKLAQNITFARDFIQPGNDTADPARRTCRNRYARPVRRYGGLTWRASVTGSASISTNACAQG